MGLFKRVIKQINLLAKLPFPNSLVIPAVLCPKKILIHLPMGPCDNLGANPGFVCRGFVSYLYKRGSF